MSKLLLLALVWTGAMQPATLTYYGEGDGFAGQHPGAYWHGKDCTPDTVDDDFFGAAAPRDIPYCTEVLVLHEDKAIVVTVVDRQRDDELHGRPHFDLWPAAAEGLGYKHEGLVEAKFIVLKGD